MTEEYESIIDNEPVARKVLTLFYIIDTSGSMAGRKIGTVNSIMSEVIGDIRDIGGSDSEVRFQAMTFDDAVQWVYDEPVSIEDVKWVDLTAGGGTDLGSALEELNSKLSRNGFMNTPSLSFAPVIFLLSDGCPNYDYKKGLEKIRGNKWFRYALKIGVGIGDDARDDILAEFTGNMETVVHADGKTELKRLIREITITSSMIGSKSSTIDSTGGIITPEQADRAKQDELAKKVVEIKDKASTIRPEDIDSGW